jgi:septal ring factor EnvC (AmiA/AmiB activator)
MKNYTFKYILVIILFFNFNSFANRDKINQKKKELIEIRNEIKEIQRKITEFNKIEKKSINDIENYNKQTEALHNLIVKLRNEEKYKEGQIAAIEISIAETEKSIKELKSNYANYIKWLYKKGKNIDLILLFNSKSINNTILRYKYLNKISEQKKKDLIKLSEQLEQLKLLKAQLVDEKEAKREITRYKEEEERRLKKELENKQKYLKELRKDKKNLIAELKLKEKAHLQIQNIINSIPDDDYKTIKPKNNTDNNIVSSQKNRNSNKKNTIPETQNFSQTSTNVNFISPVKGSIIRPFGNVYNDKLNTTTVNYGVDIRVNGNANVVAAADGKISRVEFIPGYGNVVIIAHENNTRTVYGHLSNISIVEGQYVKAGQKLGLVEESLEGYIFHFEIWKQKNCINPAHYIAQR